jgi:hypothetical protein
MRSKMKKTFVIQVEYPDCDTVLSEELIEVTKESFEYLLSRYFGANIMDGDYDRIKVKEVTDGFSLVKRMREAQERAEMITGEEDINFIDMLFVERREAETEVDEYLKKMEDNERRKALEAENTEFDYGHNVKHYSED